LVERVRNAYERMNDSPTHPSILTWKLLIITHGSEPSNSFFVTGTMLMMPGLRPTVTPPPMLAPTPGRMPSGSGETTSVPRMPSDELSPAVPVSETPLDVLMSIPQPIWYPTSMTPPGSLSPDPTSEPLNVPPTTYSRDDRAVVSGALATCVSSLATSVSVHPSGVLKVWGGGETTAPSGGGGTPSGSGACATAGSAGVSSGSATADGAVDIASSAHAATMARRSIDTGQTP
jgi:hypothetical protein